MKIPVTESNTSSHAYLIAVAEPAVVEHEAFRAQIGGDVRDVFQFRGFVIEIYCLPAIVVYRARSIRLRPGHDPVAQVALEGNRTAVRIAGW